MNDWDSSIVVGVMFIDFFVYSLMLCSLVLVNFTSMHLSQ